MTESQTLVRQEPLQEMAPPQPKPRVAGQPDPHAERVHELGLERHIQELDTQGYSILPPESVAPPEFVERVREALLRAAYNRTGIVHRLDQNGDHGSYRTETGGRPGTSNLTLFNVLFEDPVFEDWLENPAMTAIVNYCLRGQAHLSSYTSFIKWRDADGNPDKWTVPLHSDSPTGPDGVLLHDWTINSAYCLTDYKRENGPIWMVPGRQTRQPGPGEGVDRAIPIEAPAGSLIFFRTWHGSRAKMTDGLRVVLTTFFSNRQLKTLDRYQREVPKWMLDRHSEQFARYLGADDSSGAGILGPEKNYFGHSSVY